MEYVNTLFWKFNVWRRHNVVGSGQACSPRYGSGYRMDPRSLTSVPTGPENFG